MDEAIQTTQEKDPSLTNLAELRNQLVSEVTSGKRPKEDLIDFANLLTKQLENGGSLSPVAQVAGQLAEQAFIPDRSGVINTVGDVTHAANEVPQGQSASGGGRVND